MDRLDPLFDELAAGRLDRRAFLRRAAALGLSAPLLSVLGSSHILAAQPEENRIRWVSPRGRLEVLDDYPYWVAKQFGYFGDIETVIEGGPGTATATVTLVDQGQSDMGYPSPGVFSLGLEQGVPVVSVWEMGALDVFDFAFRRGEMPESLTELEGKTVVLGDAGWQAICDPIFASQGVDHTAINYVAAGVTAWGQALQQGQGDAALAWEGLRAQWKGEGLDFEYWLGKEHSRFPANSFVIRRSDFEDPSLTDLYTRYLRGWAMGLEFGHHNPRAATQITMAVPELADALNQSFPDRGVAVESMWELALVFRGRWEEREGWGWHDLTSWQLFLDTIREIGQLTRDISAEDICKNDYIAGANDFDHEQVRAEAMAYALTPEYEAVPEPEGAGA